tara:strand:- start:265 stop:369 length:105 start_codon:yes stop_codon:yes gene_type:complete
MNEAFGIMLGELPHSMNEIAKTKGIADLFMQDLR